MQERGHRTIMAAETREHSFEQFERAGFPTVKQEDWKYTNVALSRKRISRL